MVQRKVNSKNKQKKQTPWPLVRERTIPTGIVNSKESEIEIMLLESKCLDSLIVGRIDAMQ
jgi:hypothetical protein